MENTGTNPDLTPIFVILSRLPSISVHELPQMENIDDNPLPLG